MAALERIDSGDVWHSGDAWPSTPRRCDIEKLASEVFNVLAKGEDAMSVEDFQRCSTVLAQLSDDFAKAPAEVFQRMDRNRDALVQRDEFVDEVQNIAELVGSRKVAAAIQDVKHVADLLREQAAREAALAEAQLAAIRSSRPPSSRPPSSRPPSGMRQQSSARRPSGETPFELDIRPKPLHPRGQRDKLKEVQAREKVFENMIRYFQSLRKDYEDKLERVKVEQKDLLGAEGAEALMAPPVPRIFGMVGPRKEAESTKVGGDGSAAGAEAAADATGGERDGAGKSEAEEQQEEEDEDEADDVDEVEDSDEEEEDEEDDEDDDEDEEDDSGEEDDEDADQGEMSPTAKPTDESKGHVEAATTHWRFTPEDGKAIKPLKVPNLSGDVNDDEPLMEPGTVVEVIREERGADGVLFLQLADAAGWLYETQPGVGIMCVRAGLVGEDSEGVAALAAAESQKSLEPTATHAEADSHAALDGVPTEGSEEVAAAAPAEPTDEAGAENPAAAEPKQGKRKKKPSKKERKAKEKKGRSAMPHSVKVGVGRSPRPSDGAPNASDRSPRPDDEAAATPKGERDTAPLTSARPAKGRARAKLDEEGVQCVQELDMGLAIRSAVCIGREVWCADWKGNVTIRERDDASKVKAEIPTNRFVMCMAYMAPQMIWMGQEAQGISVFNTLKKRFEAVLTGGHTGGVFCLALDEALGDEVEGAFPVRRGWSGSNDFTIRQWWIETFLSKQPPPERVSSNPSSVIVHLGRMSVGISRGLQMHGHTNGVRALVRIGPHLWSGADDGTIRIWHCADGSCMEVIEDAHKGSVLKLSVVRSYVWSCGSDGFIKEWQIGGDAESRCIRQLAPEGFEKGAYAIVPLGKDVWCTGHHPNIKVISQVEMEKSMEYPAHEPYISNLLAVDRIETRILWSTSLADRKLKVWRHTIRGNVPNMDELKAANKLYEDEEQTRAERMAALVAEAEALRTQIEVGGEEYKTQLDGLAQELAEEKAAREAVEEQRKLLQEEMDGLRRLFEEAGLGDLLDDPEALRGFLDIKRLFDEAGLGHLLKDPEALKKFLAVGQAFNEVGLGKLLEDPAALRDFLNRAAQIEDVLRSLGLEDVLHDPGKLKDMLQSFLSLKEMLEKYGFGEAVRDSSVLAEILSRYNGLKEAFEEHGFPDLFEDPTTLKGFLRNYARIREEFRNVDLEYLMDSAPAMRDFLAKHGQSQKELEDLRLIAAKLELVEKSLSRTKSELASALAELESLRARLKEYTDICPDPATLRKWKDEALQYRGVLKLKKEADSELEEMKRLLEAKEQERLDALERERAMAMKYKELDIFKLDIIARELKKLDNELGMVGKSVKALQNDAGRLKNYDEREQICPHGDKMMDQCKDLRSHIRDVIEKCLSETQKMHIGVAIDDPLAAGELKDGGVMAGYVIEEVEVPDYGSSKAGKLRHGDELRREREARRSPARSMSPAPTSSSALQAGARAVMGRASSDQ